MKRLMILTMAGFSLAGCNDGIGDYGVGCPPLINYSSEVQKKVASELREHPNSETAKMIRDYGKMRRACRVTQ